MPNNLDPEFQRNVGFKHAVGRTNTDVDKSTVEENTFTAGYITAGEVLITDLPYNDPESAINSGVISSGTLVLNPDITVGGKYRAFDCPKIPVAHPAKHGNRYAPKFFHSSGVPIIEGDLFAYSVFYHDVGKLVLERNSLTDQWADPFLIDGFFYEGKRLSDIEFENIGSGNVTVEYLVQVSGELQNKIDDLQISGTPVLMKFGVENGDTFAGSPLQKSVVFPAAFNSNNLSIVVTSTKNRNFYIGENYNSGGFTIFSSSNRPMKSIDKVFWHAAQIL